MNFTIDIKALSDAAGNAVTNGRKIEAWGHWRMVASEGAATLTSTDGQTSREDRIACTVAAEGAATCDPKLLRASLAGLSGTCQVAIDGARVRIKHPRGTVRLPALAPDALPAFDARGEVLATADAEAVLAAAARVAYCANNADARYWARGVLIRDGKVVATAGTRLALTEIEGASGLPEMLIPVDALAQLRAAGGGELHAIGDAGAFACSVANGDARVRTTLIDERFPDVDRVLRAIRQQHGHARFAAGEAIAALGRLLPLTDSKNMFPVRMVAREGAVWFSTPDDAGEERVDAAIVDCDEAEIQINARAVLDVLRMGAGDVQWWFAADEELAQLFTFPEHVRELHVVMPMRRSKG